MLLPVPSQVGYLALGALILGESAGLPLPGETALITAGGLVAAGHLSLVLVILVGALAAITGDTMGYWIGRRGGRALLLRDGLGATHRRHAVRRADWFFHRYGTATVFFGRWVPGVRIVAAVMAGAAHMPWPRFALANAAGAFAWAGTVATLAMLAGPTGALLLAAGGLAIGGITLVATWWAHRRRGPAGAEPARSAGPRGASAAGRR
jgi:membrane protein DedA with SNARE-associated domain